MSFPLCIFRFQWLPVDKRFRDVELQHTSSNPTASTDTPSESHNPSTAGDGVPASPRGDNAAEGDSVVGNGVRVVRGSLTVHESCGEGMLALRYVCVCMCFKGPVRWNNTLLPSSPPSSAADVEYVCGRNKNSPVGCTSNRYFQAQV